jgi:hypothetical protein
VNQGHVGFGAVFLLIGYLSRCDIDCFLLINQPLAEHRSQLVGGCNGSQVEIGVDLSWLAG